MEVNLGHQNVVASWFGDKTDNAGNVNLSEDTTSDDNESESKTCHVNIVSYLGEKLGKKLNKNKRKHNELAKEENHHMNWHKKNRDRIDANSDEDSKVKVVCKKHKKQEVQLKYTNGSSQQRINHIENRLKDPAMSKHVRKRLKKQLHKLLDGELCCSGE